MYSFAVLISACTFLRYCATAETTLPLTVEQQEDHSSNPGDQSTGAKAALPLTPLPDTEIRQNYGNYNFPFAPGYRPSQNKKCPLCDSSVYPYCGEKLLHDACCCTDPYIHELPYQCKLADCRFLHANSCRDHRLIANCCCSDDYRSLLKNFVAP